MNRKKRKLEFIREKNKIRNGKPVGSTFKAPAKYDPETNTITVLTNLQEVEKRIYKKWRLKLTNHDYNVDYLGDDRERGVVTVVMKSTI